MLYEICLRDMILDLMRYCSILYIPNGMIDRDRQNGDSMEHVMIRIPITY